MESPARSRLSYLSEPNGLAGRVGISALPGGELQKMIGGADAPPREQAGVSQAETARSSDRAIDPASQKPQTDSQNLEP